MSTFFPPIGASQFTLMSTHHVSRSWKQYYFAAGTLTFLHLEITLKGVRDNMVLSRKASTLEPSND